MVGAMIRNFGPAGWSAAIVAVALGFAPHLGSARDDGETEPQPTEELSVEASRRASSLFDSTLSPFCPGRTLASCPSSKATAWRQDIRTWVAQGLGDEEIVARLQQRVPGFQLEGTPSTDWSWAGPLLVMALLTLAFVLGGQRAVRARRSEAPAAPPAASADDPDRERLERELEQLE